MPVSSQVSIPRPVVAGGGNSPRLPSINGGALLGQIIQEIKEARERSGLKDAITTAAPDFNPEVTNNLGLTNLRTLANDLTGRNVATNERGRNIEGANSFLQAINKLSGDPSAVPEVARQTERNNANLIEALARGNTIQGDGDNVDLFVDQDTTPLKPFDPVDFSAPTTFLQRLTRGLSGEEASPQDINSFQQRINNNPAFAKTINEQIQPTLTPQETANIEIAKQASIEANKQAFKKANPTFNVRSVPAGIDNEGKQLFQEVFIDPNDPNKKVIPILDEGGKPLIGRKGSGGVTVNIEGDPAPTGERRELVGIVDIQKQLDSISGLADEDFTGPMDSIVGGLLDSFDATAKPKRIEFKRLVRDLSDSVLRARSGAAINESEAERLLKFIPNVEDTDQVFKSKLNGFRNQIQQMRSTREEALTGSGFKDPFVKKDFRKMSKEELLQDIPQF